MADMQKQINVLGAGQRVLHDQMAEMVASQTELPSRIEEAIERGFEKSIDKLIDKAQQRAAETTGRWLWGTVKAALTKWLVIALIAFLAYAYMGPSSVPAVLGAIKAKP